MKVWNSIDFFNAYKSSKLMINNDSVKSGLVTGLAWDTIMTWFEDSGIDISESCTWGAYSTTSYSVNGWYFLCGDFVGEWINGAFPKNVFDQQVDKRYGHASGLNSNGYQKDIADIGGNLFEWSCEQSTETSYYFAYRGGCMQHGNMDLGASWHGYPSIRASNSGYWAYPNARI